MNRTMGTASWQAPLVPHRGFRRRCASVLALLIVLFLVGCGHIEFPDQVVEPSHVGIVTALEHEPGFLIAVYDDQRLKLPTDEPHPAVNVDSLMLYWGDAEPPFVTFVASTGRPGPTCYRQQPEAAFNEPEAIVLVLRDNLELGIRVPKAETYEADPLEYDDETGAFTLPAPDFCLNETGEVVAGGELDD